jgi:hypothetical protein
MFLVVEKKDLQTISNEYAAFDTFCIKFNWLISSAIPLSINIAVKLKAILRWFGLDDV